jgi:hypothetical protein
MPRVPGTELGLTPLIQFAVLTVVVLVSFLPKWRHASATR